MTGMSGDDWHDGHDAGQMGVVGRRRCVPPATREDDMTTSNPNAPQPAGADPAGEDHDREVDPLLQRTMKGAVPDEQTGAMSSSDRPDPDADDVDEDKRASGA